MKHLIAVTSVANGAATSRVTPPAQCPRCKRFRGTIVHRPDAGAWCDMCEAELFACTACGDGCATSTEDCDRCKGTNRRVCECEEHPAVRVVSDKDGTRWWYCEGCWDEYLANERAPT